APAADGGTRVVPPLLPVAAVRRDAATRVHRAGAGVRPQAAVDGRAVRRARRDHAGGDELRVAAAVAGDAQDGGVRDALDRGGGVPVVAHRGDDGATWPDPRGDRGGPAVPA